MPENSPRSLLTPNLPIWLAILMFVAAPALRSRGIGADSAQAVKTSNGGELDANDAAKDVEKAVAAIDAKPESSESNREQPMRRTMSCLEPLASYFGRESGDFVEENRSGLVTVNGITGQKKQNLCEFVRADNREVDCLIAVVPSPIRSRQKYLFDVMVSAIQSAIECTPDKADNQTPYYFDGAWFPWTQPGADVKRT